MDQAENPISRPAGSSGIADIGERRDMPRCAVDVPATLVILTQGTMLVGRMTELSLSGCRVLLPKTLTRAALAAIECTFKVRGVGFRLGGVVEWADNNRVGLQFNSMSSRSRDDLAEVLCEVELENNAKLSDPVQPVAEISADEHASAAPAIQSILAEVAALKPSAPRQTAAVWNPFSGMATGGVFRKSTDLPPVAPRLPAANAAPAPAPSNSVPPKPVPADFSPAAIPAPLSAPQDPGASNQAASASDSKPSSRGRDRRAAQRCGVDTSAIIDLVKVGSRLGGQIVDLSVGGCRIKTAEKFPVGIYTRIETEFKLHGLPFRLGGVIQAIHDRNTVGIRFLDMSDRKRSQIAELVTEMEQAQHS